MSVEISVNGEVLTAYLNGEIDAKWYNLFFKFKDWYTS